MTRNVLSQNKNDRLEQNVKMKEKSEAEIFDSLLSALVLPLKLGKYCKNVYIIFITLTGICCYFLGK